MYLAELPWRRGCSVIRCAQEGSSVFSLFSLIKLHLASLPLASRYSCQTFSFSFFPCSADHERDWPPCKVVFFGLATNALNVRNNNNSRVAVSSVFWAQYIYIFGPNAWGPVKCHEYILYLQPIIPPKNVLTFSPPDWGMLRRSSCQIFL